MSDLYDLTPSDFLARLTVAHVSPAPVVSSLIWVTDIGPAARSSRRNSIPSARGRFAPAPGTLVGCLQRLIRRGLDVAVIPLNRGRNNLPARLAYQALLETKREALTKGCEIVLNGEK